MSVISPLSLALVTLSLCALSSLCSATNYNSLINEITRRSQHVHDTFMDTPGVRDHVFQELGGLYDDQGYLTAVPAEEGDTDAQWQRILKSVNNVREARRGDLQSLHKKLRNDERFYASPFNLEDSDDEEDEQEGDLAADQRSEEVAYKNHLSGEQKVSGGSGKSPVSGGKNGVPHAIEVKTDKLPGYCDPPNPCPIGVDPAKLPAPCDANIPNTKAFNKQWIWTKMQNGECSCDTEHMETCPTPRGASNMKLQEEDLEKRNPHVHRSVVKKAGPYSAI
jgi:hypothetical protein